MTSCIWRSLLSVILAALSWRLLKTFPKFIWQKMWAIEKITPSNVCQPTKFHKREKTESISRGAESDLRLEKTWKIRTMSLEIKFIKYPEVLSARIWWREFCSFCLWLRFTSFKFGGKRLSKDSFPYDAYKWLKIQSVTALNSRSLFFVNSVQIDSQPKMLNR